MSLIPSKATGGFGQAIIILCIGVSTWLYAAASAQESPLGICHAPSGQKEFIQGSLQMVKEGVPRERALDELACISDNRALEAQIRGGALAALLHIADDDETIRQYLLAMIRNHRSRTGECHNTGCRLLMYVADTSARQALLEEVKKSWPELCDSAFFVLADLGDADFLKWLEDVMSDMAPEHPRRQFFQEMARYVRSQRSVRDLLEFLKTERHMVANWTIISQAIRHGATPDQLRTVYWEKINQCRNDLAEKSKCRMLVDTAIRRGFFDATDIEALPEHLKMSLERPEGNLDTSRWPSWAKLMEDKEKQFWRGYRFRRQEN